MVARIDGIPFPKPLPASGAALVLKGTHLLAGNLFATYSKLKGTGDTLSEASKVDSFVRILFTIPFPKF